MTPPADEHVPTESLRQQAETVLQNVLHAPANLSDAEPQSFVHELQVHQVELELQNAELRRSQEELQIARDKYAALYDFAPVGYLTLDAQGTILQSNLTAATMLGVVRSELPGSPLSQFILHDDQDAFYLHRLQVVDAEATHTCDLQMQRPDGTQWVAQVESRGVGDPERQERQCFTTLSDITERKEAEAALRQAERLASLGTFASGLAHELNNPLYAITAGSEYARDNLISPDKLDEVDTCFGYILEDAERCTQIVQRVLNFARRGRGEKSSLDLHPLIQIAHDLTLRYAEQHGVRLSLEFAAPPPKITANAEDIELALVNFIRNAVEASSEGGHVSLQTVVSEGRVQVRIQDTGMGLSPEEVQHVFEPFFTTRQGAGGTGMGLSIAHRIITDHDGVIRFQSAPGQGLLVQIELPLSTSDTIPSA